MLPCGSRRCRALTFLLAIACAPLTHADDDTEPAVTPYRPTVSNPADLPVPGWLELEAGGLSVHGEADSRVDTLPWLLKYAFDENSGLLVGGNAFASQRTPDGQHDSGFGDTFLEWKQRFPVRDGVAFGVEAGIEAPTAPDDLGIGKPAWLINGIFSTDLGAAHLDLNLGGTRYTMKTLGASSWQSAWAAALSHPLGAGFGAAFEISGIAQHGAGHSHQALAALNYNLSRRVVLDAGVAYGLDRSAHDRSLFCGGTFLLGKLR